MAGSKIADLFNIQRRFLRSAHLERDFRDPSALDGYVVTTQIQQQPGWTRSLDSAPGASPETMALANQASRFFSHISSPAETQIFPRS